MSRAFGLSAQLLPDGIDPARDTCAECGDFIAWCPVWVRKYPYLEQSREDV